MDSVIKGVCIDTENSMVLKKGDSYFLFANGTNHYYVSKFPNEGSHFGCFEKKHFQAQEQKMDLDSDKIYKARLAYRTPGYFDVDLTDYYVQPRTTHCDFYIDKNLEKCKGCFPLEWFTDFQEIENLDEVEDEDVPINDFIELEPEHFEQMSLF